MRPRTLLLFAVAAMLAAAVAVLPALAASSEVKLEVNDNCDGFTNWPCWTPPGASPTYTRSITIASGGTVTFSDEGALAANIAWTSTPGATPTCSAQVPVSPTAAKAGWQGECKFEQPGSYKLESSTLYPTYRQYEVIVEGAGTTGTGTGSGPGTTTGSSTNPSGTGSPGQTGGPVGVANPAGSPFAGSRSAACKLASTQHGQSVRGSVEVSQAGAGGRLEVELLAAKASLARAGNAARVRVGRLVRSALPAGSDRFTVSLSARARHALHAHGHLALSVKLLLTSARGSTATLTRSVTLRS